MPIEEFKNLVITKNIRFIPHHSCGICGCYVGYYLHIKPGNEVTADFDGTCDCGGSPGRPVPLEDAAKCFENLPEYVRNVFFANI